MAKNEVSKAQKPVAAKADSLIEELAQGARNVVAKLNKALPVDEKKAKTGEAEDEALASSDAAVAEQPILLAQANTGTMTDAGKGGMVASTTETGGSTGLTGVQIALGALAIGGIAAAAGGGGGGGSAAPTFTATASGGVLTFGGTQTGAISAETVGGNTIFTRGGLTQTVTGTLANHTITLPAGVTSLAVLAGDTLQLDSVTADGLPITGAGSLTIVPAAFLNTGAAETATIALNVVLTNGSILFDLPADDLDTLTLSAGSTINLGTGILTVSDGTVDLSQTTLTIGGLVINSKVILTPAQFADLIAQGVTVNTLDDGIPGEIQIVVTTAQEALDVQGLLQQFSTDGLATGGPVAISFEIQPAVGENAVTIANDLAASLAAAVISTTEIVSVTPANATIILSQPASVADIDALIADGYTLANITFVLSDSDTNLLANPLYVAQATSIAVTGAATAANLLLLDPQTTPDVDASAATPITGTVAELLNLLGANVTLGASFVPVLSGTALATDLVTINAATLGLVNATGVTQITGTADEFSTLLATNVPSTTISLNPTTTVVTGAATVAQLNAIDAITTGTVNATGVGPVTAQDIAEISALIALEATTALDLNPVGYDVVVLSPIDVTQANYINGSNGNGVVTATISSAAPSQLITLTGTNHYTITVTGTATAANLNTINGKTDLLVDATNVYYIEGDISEFQTLWAASSEISLAPNYDADLTGGANVTVAQAQDIVTVTTGEIWANINETDAATLVNLPVGYWWDVTVTGTATAAQLNLIDNATNWTVNANPVSLVTGSSAELNTLLNGDISLNNLPPGLSITVTDAIGVTTANYFAGSASGVVTATIIDHDAATLAGLESGNAWTVSVTGTASAAHLNQIDSSTSVVVDATGVTHITGYAAEFLTLRTNAVTNETTDLSGAWTAQVWDALSVAQANLLAPATNGVITATITADTAANLTALEAGNAWNVTVNGGTASAENLNIVNSRTSVTVNATSLTTITGDGTSLTALAQAKFAGTINLPASFAVSATGPITAAQLEAIDAINGSGVITATMTGSELDYFTVAGGTTLTSAAAAQLAANHPATVTGPITVAQANVLSGATTGIVTATISDTLLSALNGLSTDAQVNAYTITVSDTTADVGVLNTLQAKTTVSVDATSVTTLNGTGAQFETAISTVGLLSTATDVAANVSGAPTAAQVDIIDAATTGLVTATIATTSAANILAGLSDTLDVDALTITINDSTVSATDLLALDDRTSVVVHATTPGEITGNSADVLNALDDQATIDTATNVNIVLSGAYTDLDINDIDAANGTGTITYNGTAAGETLDFTGVTANLIINALGGNDLVYGGSGNDTINAGAGNDQVDLLNGGADTVVLGTYAANGADIVWNFGADDRISFAAIANGYDGPQGDLSAQASLGAAAALAISTNGSVGNNAVSFTYGAFDYVVIDTGIAGFDSNFDAVFAVALSNISSASFIPIA